MKTKTLKPRKQNKNLLLRGFNQTHKDMVSWQMIMTNTHLQVQYMYTRVNHLKHHSQIYTVNSVIFTLLHLQTISPCLFFKFTY